MIGPLETMVSITNENRITINTEQKAKQKWHFLLLKSLYECLVKNNAEGKNFYVCNCYSSEVESIFLTLLRGTNLMLKALLSL